jgi:hypothetical protein
VNASLIFSKGIGMTLSTGRGDILPGDEGFWVQGALEIVGTVTVATGGRPFNTPFYGTTMDAFLVNNPRQDPIGNAPMFLDKGHIGVASITGLLQIQGVHLGHDVVFGIDIVGAVAVRAARRILYPAFDGLRMEAPLVDLIHLVMALAAVNRFELRGMLRLHILQIGGQPTQEMSACTEFSQFALSTYKETSLPDSSILASSLSLWHLKQRLFRPPRASLGRG